MLSEIQRIMKTSDAMLAQRDQQIAGLEARCVEHIKEIERLGRELTEARGRLAVCDACGPYYGVSEGS